jgi:hypothetical protein
VNLGFDLRRAFNELGNSEDSLECFDDAVTDAIAIALVLVLGLQELGCRLLITVTVAKGSNQ